MSSEDLTDTIAQAQRFLQGGRAQDAMSLCDTARKQAPHHPTLLKLGAIAAFQCGDPAKATGLLEDAVTHFPDDAEAHFNLGVVNQGQGLLTAALANFSRSAELVPDSAGAHYNRGTALHELSRPEEAVEAYRTAIASAPGYAPAHAGLAFVLRSLGELEAAAESYEQALRLDPADPQTQSGYGVTLQHLGRLPEAAKALADATALDPDYPDAVTNLADVLVQQCDPGAGVAACERFLQRQPGVRVSWQQRPSRLVKAAKRRRSRGWSISTASSSPKSKPHRAASPTSHRSTRHWPNRCWRTRPWLTPRRAT